MAIKTFTFTYTGSVQTIAIPDGVQSVKMECYGASGGSDGGAPIRYGGYCYGEYRFSNFKNNKLYIYVGGAGVTGAAAAGGGWNGGGNAGPSGSSGGGGGASDVRTTYNTNWKLNLSDRIIVAGGAGGAGNGSPGGIGGGLIGGTGNGGATGGSQTAPGVGSNGTGGFGYGGNHSGDGGGGGGGWYGGGAGNGDNGGGGGSSYYGSLLNAGTTAGVNNGNGQVVITYEDDTSLFFLEKDSKYYIPKAEYFNIHSKTFNSLTIDYIMENLLDDYDNLRVMNLNDEFTLNGETFIPADILDFSQYKICVLTIKDLTDLSVNYIPSNLALLKTNIKVKDEYIPFSEDLFNAYVDIVANDKSKIEYTITYPENDISDKNTSLLNIEILEDNFYLTFRFNNPDGLLKSIMLYNRDLNNYNKIKEDDLIVETDYINTYMTCEVAYKEVLINKITKQYFKYLNETLDKF